nr:hypothetical protein [Microbacterium barkeri]
MLVLRNTLITAASCAAALMVAHFTGGAPLVGIIAVFGSLLPFALTLVAVVLISRKAPGIGLLLLFFLVLSYYVLAPFIATYLGFTFLSLFIVGGVGFGTGAYLDAKEREEKRARRKAERVASGEAAAEKRRVVVKAALSDVPREWLLDVLSAAEDTRRAVLIDRTADLPEGTEYALVRAHRKGVKPDAVAPFVAAGAFTEADADLLAKEVA